MNELSLPPDKSPTQNDARSGDGPDPQPPPGGASAPQQPTGSKPKPVIPSAEECVGKIAQLPGLLFLGLVKPPAANSMRACLNDIVAYHGRQQQASAPGAISDDNLLRILREKPEFITMLHGILSDEQIQFVMAQVKSE